MESVNSDPTEEEKAKLMESNNAWYSHVDHRDA
jgi:hypothetical protein